MAKRWCWFLALLPLSACDTRGGENHFLALERAAAADETPADACATTPVISGLRAGGKSEPWNLQVDGGFVYFIQVLSQVSGNVTTTSFLLNRVDKNGGAAQTVGSVDPDRATYALSDTRIFSVVVGQQGFPGWVVSTNKDGSDRYVVFAVSTSCRTPTVDDLVSAPDGSVIFAQHDLPQGACGAGDVYWLERIPPGSKNPTAIRMPASSLFAELHLTDRWVWWKDAEGIWFGSKENGDVTELIDASPTASVAAEYRPAGSSIVWTSATEPNGDGKTYRQDLGATDAVEIFPSRLFGLTVAGPDSTTPLVYGLALRAPGTGAEANLLRMKPNGHGQTWLAHAALTEAPADFGPTRGASFAIDDQYIYFVDPSTDAILKTCR